MIVKSGLEFLTASSLTQSKELLRHYQETSRHLPNLKHITSCYDMKWYDCIKTHHIGLGQVKTCFKMGKKNRKRNGKEKLKEKYRIEHELTGLF